MARFPMCPKCNIPIDWEDSIDTYKDNDENHIEFCVGRCSNCGTNYQWEEKYVYNGIQNLKED